MCLRALVAILVLSFPLHAAYFQSERGPYGIQFDSEEWSPVDEHRKPNSDAEFMLVGGQGYALTIFEEGSISLEDLKQAVIDNMRQFDPGAAVVDQGAFEVQSRDILFLKLEAVYNQIPFSYYGYFYSGDLGTLQIIAFTTSNFAPKVEASFERLLTGLVFREEPAQADR